MMFFSTSIFSNHFSNRSNHRDYAFTFPDFYRLTQYLSLTNNSAPNQDFPPGETAYDILGVSESSSFSEIKSSFHKLAKQTHPDLSDSSSSRRFVQILAAYEILSDLEKRAHYDSYLLSLRKKVVHKQSNSTPFYSYESRTVRRYDEDMEVVEWLRWYRTAINNVLAEKRVATGTGYLDELEADFYSAIHAAYFGPLIESMELLPDRFEAEERSVWDTNEVLHLVSGRDLFGMVCLVNNADKTCKLDSFVSRERLESFNGVGIGSSVVKSNVVGDGGSGVGVSDIYRGLELHVSGKVVAVANRVPPGTRDDGVDKVDDQDEIKVFLSSGVDYRQGGDGFLRNSFVDGGGISMIPLGTIVGLGTSTEEGSCFVYDSSGTKTHVIMKHRTLMVKHLHWYNLGDEVSVCECRCSRARLPPSKYWLFEPRCGMHDIGGWYVETYGRDKKGRTVPSQRYWDGLDGSEQYDRRLHPAMYLLALAYRTLDIEDARRRKHTIRTFIEGQLFRVLQWCKKLV